MYQYKTVQVPQSISVKKGLQSTAAAVYLGDVISNESAQGWEFYSVETIGVMVPAGCLLAFFGAKPTFNNYYVVVFRKD